MPRPVLVANIYLWRWDIETPAPNMNLFFSMLLHCLIVLQVLPILLSFLLLILHYFFQVGHTFVFQANSL